MNTPHTRTVRSVEHLLQRYLLLICIIAGVCLATLIPGPGRWFAELHIGALLIAGIFLLQGLGMDTSGIKNVRRFLPALGAGVLIALILYPAAAALTAKVLGLTRDDTIGLILISAMPTTLAAAIPMTVSAGGDPLTAVVLVIFLNLLGLVSIPLNLHLWLGSHTAIAPASILTTLLVCLFLPMGAGQLFRRFKPDTARVLHDKTRDLPKILLGLLVYISCVKESALFAEMKLIDIVRLIGPCLLVHLSMLGVSWAVASKGLKLPSDRVRAFSLICSEKPVTLSVALWSLHFSATHAPAVFPLIMFYVLQMVTDSVAASTMAKKTRE